MPAERNSWFLFMVMSAWETCLYNEKFGREQTIMAENCQIQTPEKYVRHMLDYIDYNTGIYGKRILENSCGTGNILLEIVTRYIENAQAKNISLRDIQAGLSRDIYAYEIDKNRMLTPI